VIHAIKYVCNDLWPTLQAYVYGNIFRMARIALASSDLREESRSRLALLSFSVFLSSLLSPSPNPNLATRVGGGVGESARRRRRRRLCRLDGGCATCAGGDSCLEQVVVVKEI